MGAVFSCCGCAAPLQLLAGTATGPTHMTDVKFTGTLLPPRSTPTGAVLRSLEHVHNARDLAEATDRIAPGRIFRSACPNAASEADADALQQTLGISELVDLRSGEERAVDKASRLVAVNGIAQLPEAAQSAADVQESGIAAGPGAEQASQQHAADSHKPDNELAAAARDTESEQPESKATSLVVHHVALLDKNQYYKALMRRIPRSTAASALFWSLLNRPYAMSLIIQEVNHGGLAQLYEILLESATAQIVAALRLVLNAAEAGRNALLFCKIGKDRTGLIAALILAACGATDDEIVSDYARSDSPDGIALGGLEKMKELEGLDHKQFESAPPSAMATVLQYLRTNYGGVAQYLEHIGFGEKEQERLRLSLSSS